MNVSLDGINCHQNSIVETTAQRSLFLYDSKQFSKREQPTYEQFEDTKGGGGGG
jgi:hypothetical protein